MSKKLYVGNLPYQLSDAELAEIFSQWGPVISAVHMKDAYSGEPRGFGFVELQDEKLDEAIAATNGLAIKGRQLRVNAARPRDDRPRDDRPREERGGGGGGERRGGGGGGGGERRGGGGRGGYGGDSYGDSGGGGGGGGRRGGRSHDNW